MFKKARIKLTAWYLLIIMCVSVMFSAGIYRVLTIELNRFEELHRLRMERRFLEDDLLMPSPPRNLFFRLPDPELINDTKNRILFTLIVVNGVILALSGALGYLLAGRTLLPIALMVEDQNRFISDASHELKTPLTSLKTAFEVYLRGKSKTLVSANSIIKDSILEVNKMQRLSESLLTLSQHQTSQQQRKFSRIPVSDLIDKAVKRINPLAKAKEITIKYAKNGSRVYGSAYSLEDLMVILLDNAVKYSKKCSEVTVMVSNNNKLTEIKVIDCGIGIAKEDLPHIFDRFYRSDTARTKNGNDGFGLGLSIAKKIVEEHHGSIKAESRIGQGSEFRVILPSA